MMTGSTFGLSLPVPSMDSIRSCFENFFIISHFAVSVRWPFFSGKLFEGKLLYFYG